MVPVGIILLLITVGSVVAPVGAVVLIYRDDLTQLVITPEIKQILNGNLSFLLNSEYINSQNQTTDETIDFVAEIVTPTFVNSTFDYATGTFTVTLSVTDGFKYDLSLNSLSADVVSAKDNFDLASVSLSSPATITSGKTSMITVNGALSANVENYFYTNYATANSIDVNLVNFKIDVNGITYQPSEPISVGNIPFLMVGS